MTQPLDRAEVAQQAESLLNQVNRWKEHDEFRKAADKLQAFVQLNAPLLPADVARRLAQQQALCTYKNIEIPAEIRLDQAMQILQQADPLETSTDAETLGLAGAIGKRQWRETGQRSGLERALRWYRKGASHNYPQGWHDKQAYCAINLAFLLEQYAQLMETSSLGEMTLVAELRQEAHQWRQRILIDSDVLAQQQDGDDLWWTQVTLAEAWFAEGEFEKAEGCFQQARALYNSQPWQLETLVRQLSELTAIRWPKQPEKQQQARAVMASVMQHEAALDSICQGTLGLALSGGGFRASFYHIGVLARLAELNLLRRVEVISCVSGGSILGAAYYLELQKLLETRADDEIRREDYIALVRRLESNFLAGVQTDIRTSVFSNPLKLLKMVKPGYSRTHRLAELYEERLYRRIDDGKGDKPRYMSQLMINPAGTEPGNFRPRYHNWTRVNKVPMLVLNATTLNTGHSWQFTASWMGGAPWAIDADIDRNAQLNWFYYTDAPASKYQQMSLGQAVAASSCVPGLFRPLVMKGLYHDMTVRLVDGGVYDNQGAAALLQKGCDHILVSDASGQLDTSEDSSSSELKVVSRASEIFQERMRTVQQKGLRTRRRNGLLKSLCHIHLKKDLYSENPTLSNQPPAVAEKRSALTDYGINRDYQRAIAAIRTDLDSFSDNEAHALMYSGYQMAGHYLPEELKAQCSHNDSSQCWGFMALAEKLSDMATDEALLEELRVARHRFFRSVIEEGEG